MSGWDMGDISIKKELKDIKHNRRSSKRLKFLKKIKFGINDAVSPGNSYNISQNGMLVHSLKAFLPNTALNIKIYSDTEVLNLSAEVKWVTKSRDTSGSFMGICFMGKNFKLRKLYLKELKLSQNPDLHL